MYAKNLRLFCKDAFQFASTSPASIAQPAVTCKQLVFALGIPPGWAGTVAAGTVNPAQTKALLEYILFINH